MKRYKSLVLAAALLTSFVSFGQSESYNSSIGPVMGMGVSRISNANTNATFSGQLGIGGVFSRYEHWGWGGLLTVSHEGYSYDYVRNGRLYNNTVDPVYLRMVPRAYYFFGSYKSVVRPKVFLGPSLGIKLVEDHYIDENMPLSDYDIDMKHRYGDFNVLDFGVNTGVGLNIKIAPKTWLNLEGEYYQGLTQATVYGDMNSTLRGNVGFMFGF
ncbi:MAG: PorT family protein [Bacteroidetes bacterium]|nr:PorT family protein [Bacteroidota bacterium]